MDANLRDKVLAGVDRVLSGAQSPERAVVLRSLAAVLAELPARRGARTLTPKVRQKFVRVLHVLPSGVSTEVSMALDRGLAAAGFTSRVASAPTPDATARKRRPAGSARSEDGSSFVSSFYGQDVPWSTDD